MNTTLTLDKAGRVVLPKPIRDELQLSPGDSLEVETSEDQIVLRPVRGTSRLRKKQGFGFSMSMNRSPQRRSIGRCKISAASGSSLGWAAKK
jgi:AbrB family looped-hinge helix DNA binding protein